MTKPPTAKQLADAADTILRFIATTELGPFDEPQARYVAHMIGMAALRERRYQRQKAGREGAWARAAR